MSRRSIWIDAARVASFRERDLWCPFDFTEGAAALRAAREMDWSPIATKVLIAVCNSDRFSGQVCSIRNPRISFRRTGLGRSNCLEYCVKRSSAMDRISDFLQRRGEIRSETAEIR